MFRFEDPQYLYLLAVVVLLALIRFLTYRNQKKRLRKFGDPDLVSQLMPLVSRWRPGLKFWLLEG
ncbi:MAG: BatB/BatC protein, partial [Prevotella sp.]|nr:BatB/BatC protein [Prevotella sp.]